MLPKLDAVECELNKFDVIAVTETWLNPTISDNDISIRGYKAPYRYNRPNDNHGGVAVYVNSFPPGFRPHSVFDDISSGEFCS